MAVELRRAGEIVHARPGDVDQVSIAHGLHFHRFVGAQGENRGIPQSKALAGFTIAIAEAFTCYRHRMRSKDGTTDAKRFNFADTRGFGIHALEGVALFNTAAQPEGIQPIKRGGRVAEWQVKSEVTGFVVKAAGGVFFFVESTQLEFYPLAIGGEIFPNPRRIFATNANGFGGIGLEIKLEQVPGDIIFDIKTEIEGVAGLRGLTVEGVKGL